MPLTDQDPTLSSKNGVALDLDPGSAIPANSTGLLQIGTDGSTARVILTDSSGHPIIVGAGTAGAASGGVVSVQGTASGTALPISAAALPLPTGAAQEHTTAASPNAVRLSDGASFYDAAKTGQLPSALVGGRLDENVGAWLGSTAPTVGQKTMANSVPMTLASDQSAISISAVSLPLPSGAATEASLAAQSLIDNAAFTDGVTRVQPAGFILDETAGTALTENDVAAARVDSKRAIVNVIEDATTRGQRLVVSAAGAAKVDGSAVTQPVSGTVTANIGTSGALALDATLTGGTARIKVTDGTNNAAVKAASTAAIATDPALVVAVSPNNTVAVSMAAAPLPTGAATEATLAKLPVAQASTTSGQSGALVQGAVTTAAPTYTTAQTSPLSLTTVGSLRIDGSGVTQPISAASLPLPTGASTAAKQPALGTAGTASADVLTVQGIASMTALKVDGSAVTQPVSGTVTANAGTNLNTSALALDATLTGGTQRTKITDGTTNAAVKAASTAAIASDPALVVAISPNNPITASIADVTSTGTLGALNAALTVTMPGLASAGFQLIAGTLIGTLVPEFSFDSGTTWNATYFSDPGTGALATSLIFASANTSAARAVLVPPGNGQVRVRVSAYTSGTANGTIRASNAHSSVPLFAGVAGLPPPPITMFAGGSDGTNLTALRMKAASTAAVVGDPALVVAISPNNTVPISAATLPLPTGAATETSLAAQSLVDNAAFTDGTSRVVPAGHIFDEVAGTALTENDVAASRVDSKRAQVIAIEDAVTRGQRLTVSAAGAAKVDGSAVTQPVSGTVTANQGTAIALSGAWPIEITDGTTGPAAVKAASTAPVATDKALVVVLSPNQAAIPTTVFSSGAVTTTSFGDIILSAAATAALRRTNYTEQTVNFTGSVVSSNANDTAAGTGAQQITIYWMDATGVTKGSEVVTLNGTTVVNLATTTKAFIEKILVTRGGSGGVNAGIISLFTGSAGSGTIVGTIAASDNETFWCHHYVLSGKTCNITDCSHSNNSSVSGGTSIAFVRAKAIGVTGAVENQISSAASISGATNEATRVYGSVIQVVGPARVVMYTTVVSSTTITYRGGFSSYDQ